MEMLIILALALGAMWLMTSRTRKQQRAAADFRANLEVGQEVMTGSGLYGTIVDVDGDTITLESTPGNQTRWIRAAIAKLVPPPVDEEDDAEYEGEDGEYEDAEYGDAEYEGAEYDGAEYDDVATAGDDATTADDARSSTDRGAHRFEVPDDLSSMDERRTDDGPDRR
jgi:preprotein translocase subunit YajC